MRILIDSWLSDYPVGDLMERSVKVRIDLEQVKTIDAIYISHSHTDHFDPYTLTQIYRTSDSRFHIPILILPYTLQYLIPLIRAYLGDIEIEVLFPRRAFSLHGIEIRGHMLPQNSITNEDDVMMLSIENDHEFLFAEIDTLPEEDDIDTQKELLRILSKKSYETILYIASRNELAGDIPLLGLPPKKRRAFRDSYIAGRKEEMYFAYQKWEYEEFTNFPNIYEIPNLVRGFVGQGMCYP